MPKLGIVADDLTGGTTVGALLARAGVDTAVLFDPSFIATVEEHEALIVSTDSRPLPAAEAYERVRAATEQLRAVGAQQFAKRIDTTCRGGIGPEVEGMLSALDDDYIAVVVPSMPQSRRIVVGGYSLIDSVLLTKTGVAADVRTPVTESHLPTLLGSQFRQKVGHVGLEAVIRAPAMLEADLIKQREAGAKAILVDAISLDDVDAIASVLVDLGWKVVCVDPGPFTERLAIRSRVVTPTEGPQRTTRVESAETDEGTVLVVAGSAMSVTHAQMTELSKVPGTTAIQVRIAYLLGDQTTYNAEVDRVLREVRQAIAGGRARVILLGLESTLTGKLVELTALEAAVGLRPGQASSLMPERLGLMGRAVAEELGSRLNGLYLTGGDVMINTCQAMGASGIQLVDYVIPQADQGLLVGGPNAGVPVVCKGGMTGTDLTAIQCVNRIFDEKANQQ